MSQTVKEMMSEMEKDMVDIQQQVRSIEHRGNGSATHYYELPSGATELRHIIKHKNMGHGIGEAFCALYRLNNNGEYLRNLKKAKFYIDCEIEYEENK